MPVRSSLSTMAVFVIVILGQIILCSASTSEWSFGEQEQGSGSAFEWPFSEQDSEPTSDWSYREQENWPSSCKGVLQSPIPLPGHDIRKHHFEPIQFDRNTYERKNATVTNTGHTVEIRFTNDTQPPTISGAGLEGEYVLEAFHFHWPSEHTVNGHGYPLEGHFVYYSKQYDSLETALQNKNGVAVLAVFYQVNQYNSGFKFVKDVAAVAHRLREPVPLHHSITLISLLPLFPNTFYRYDGSLTTPPCSEVVIWTIFATPSNISSQQLKSLKGIWDAEGRRLMANNRKLQNSNGRQLLYNLPVTRHLHTL